RRQRRRGVLRHRRGPASGRPFLDQPQDHGERGLRRTVELSGEPPLSRRRQPGPHHQLAQGRPARLPVRPSGPPLPVQGAAEEVPAADRLHDGAGRGQLHVRRRQRARQPEARLPPGGAQLPGPHARARAAVAQPHRDGRHDGAVQLPLQGRPGHHGALAAAQGGHRRGRLRQDGRQELPDGHRLEGHPGAGGGHRGVPHRQRHGGRRRHVRLRRRQRRGLLPGGGPPRGGRPGRPVRAARAAHGGRPPQPEHHRRVRLGGGRPPAGGRRAHVPALPAGALQEAAGDRERAEHHAVDQEGDRGAPGGALRPGRADRRAGHPHRAPELDGQLRRQQQPDEVRLREHDADDRVRVRAAAGQGVGVPEVAAQTGRDAGRGRLRQGGAGGGVRPAGRRQDDGGGREDAEGGPHRPGDARPGVGDGHHEGAREARERDQHHQDPGRVHAGRAAPRHPGVRQARQPAGVPQAVQRLQERRIRDAQLQPADGLHQAAHFIRTTGLQGHGVPRLQEVRAPRPRRTQRPGRREPGHQDRRLRARARRPRPRLLPQEDGGPPAHEVAGARGHRAPQVHDAVRRLVVRHPPLRDRDARRQPVPVRAERGRPVPAAKERLPHGVPGQLPRRALPADARVLACQSRPEADLRQADRRPRPRP
ncbi:unnamed protein product, partial [Sphagnum tenellum]